MVAFSILQPTFQTENQSAIQLCTAVAWMFPAVANKKHALKGAFIFNFFVQPANDSREITHGLRIAHKS